MEGSRCWLPLGYTLGCSRGSDLCSWHRAALFYFIFWFSPEFFLLRRRKKTSRQSEFAAWHFGIWFFFFFIGKTPFRKKNNKKISPLFILNSHGWQLQEAVGWRTAAEPAAKPHQLAFYPALHRATLERGRPGITGGSSSEHPIRNKKWNQLWVGLCFF